MNKNRLYDYAYKMTYIYVTLPFLILAAGWMRFPYAVIVCGVVLTALWKIFRGIREENKNGTVLAKQEKKILAGAFFIIALWVGMSGIGQVAYQNDDHVWRNALFEILVNHDWPVINRSMGTGVSYYIGFWLPAACIGKLFGMSVGYHFQILWAILGIYLFYIILCKILGRISLWPIIIFICFSGMDILGCYFMGTKISDITQTEHLEWWGSLFQYSSFTTQLFWVFNQAIPAWLATIVLISRNDDENLIFLWASMLLNCTMPFVGMIPVIACRLLKKKNFSPKGFSQLAKRIFSYQNIVGAGFVGIVSLLYLYKGEGTFSVGLFNLKSGGWLLYFVFIMLEIGILGIFIYWSQKGNPLFYSSLLWLCMCPILKMYGDKNFCMRASIPALLIMAVCTMQALYRGVKEKKWKAVAPIVVVLMIGAITPLHEVNRSIAMTTASYVDGKSSIRQPSVSFEEIMNNDYETAEIEKNIFFRYLSREVK